MLSIKNKGNIFINSPIVDNNTNEIKEIILFTR